MRQFGPRQPGGQAASRGEGSHRRQLVTGAPRFGSAGELTMFCEVEGEVLAGARAEGSLSRAARNNLALPSKFPLGTDRCPGLPN